MVRLSPSNGRTRAIPSIASNRSASVSINTQPARRKADYHDPALPPRPGFLAFYFWLRETEKIDALIHCGAHGSLEWLPGKGYVLLFEGAGELHGIDESDFDTLVSILDEAHAEWKARDIPFWAFLALRECDLAGLED